MQSIIHLYCSVTSWTKKMKIETNWSNQMLLLLQKQQVLLRVYRML